MLWSCCNKVSQIIMAPKKFSLATVSSSVNNLCLNRSQSLLLKEKIFFTLSKWQQKSCLEAAEISVLTEGWGMRDAASPSTHAVTCQRGARLNSVGHNLMSRVQSFAFYPLRLAKNRPIISSAGGNNTGPVRCLPARTSLPLQSASEIFSCALTPGLGAGVHFCIVEFVEESEVNCKKKTNLS